MPINKCNAPVPVPSHGISELTRKSASGLCWAAAPALPPIPVLLSPLHPCPPFPVPTLLFFPLFPHLGVRRSSLGVSSHPHSSSHRNAAAAVRMEGVGAAARSREAPGSCPLIVPGGHIPWAPWHQPAQPGANAGVENEQQEGYREFQGCSCCLCICM